MFQRQNNRTCKEIGQSHASAVYTFALCPQMSRPFPLLNILDSPLEPIQSIPEGASNPPYKEHLSCA